MREFRFYFLALSLALAVFLDGCGGGSTTTTITPPPAPMITLSPATAAVIAGQSTQFTATTNVASSSLQWEVDGVAGGNNSVGMITSSGVYTAPNTTTAQTANITLVDTAEASAMGTAQAYDLGAATVAATANGQVAAYTINLPVAGGMAVAFGPTTSYIRDTSEAFSPTTGGAVTVLVAGMNANSTYHMQGYIALNNGLTATDVDHTFTTTQSVPTANLPTSITFTSPGTPQPGVELLTDLYHGADVYDLQGNLIWAYDPPGISTADEIQPAEMLPNGDMVLLVAPGSLDPLYTYYLVPGTLYELLEVDLAGDLINTLTMAQLQTNLNATGYLNNQGVTPQLQVIHHEMTVNPNTGHLLMIANSLETLTVGTYTGPVLGDMILDVDPSNNYAIDWIWNEFDHLDVNRHPYNFPDWTHTNAITYSPSDHNILVSSRHQNWIWKLDYEDGAATSGDILWTLGYQGSFTLMYNGAVDTNPQDWMFAQHQPAFTTTNSTGVFGLTMMDNGTDRMYSNGDICGLDGNPACYSRSPIFTIDDTAMTATISNAQPGPQYSNFGGNAEMLANGNEHSDYCAAPGGGVVAEYTVGDSPQLVWAMQAGNIDVYRSHRIGSLYPGITWTQ